MWLRVVNNSLKCRKNLLKCPKFESDYEFI